MSTICPKCRHVRQAQNTAPEWQCPACGIAYIKASAPTTTSQPATRRTSSADTEPSSSMSWIRAVAIVAIAFGAWQGVQLAANHSGSHFSGAASAEELEQLALTVKAGDVLIYTTTDCPYCAQAKSWMTQYGFKFTECDTQVRRECARELESLGGDGVPYLIVRGNHLREGFNSDRFVAALR